jgi:hypothetical protein
MTHRQLFCVAGLSQRNFPEVAQATEDNATLVSQPGNCVNPAWLFDYLGDATVATPQQM